MARQKQPVAMIFYRIIDGRLEILTSIRSECEINGHQQSFAGGYQILPTGGLEPSDGNGLYGALRELMEEMGPLVDRFVDSVLNQSPDWLIEVDENCYAFQLVYGACKMFTDMIRLPVEHKSFQWISAEAISRFCNLESSYKDGVPSGIQAISEYEKAWIMKLQEKLNH